MTGSHGIFDIALVLVNDGYASTATGPIEVFSAAGEVWKVLGGEPPPLRFRVSIASIGGDAVTSGQGLRIASDMAIEEVERADLIFVSAPSAEPAAVGRHAALLPWLRDWYERGAMIAGVCAGVAPLAEAGLLDGRRATTHWAVAESFRQRYPKVDWHTELLITEDGNLFCSGGAHAAIDLSLYLVEKLCGHEVAVQCSRWLVLDMPRTYQSGYSILPISRSHSDQKIRAIEDYLRVRFGEDFSTEDVAQHAGMSRRNFIRRFKQATGHLPGAYLQMIRVAAARQMLEEGDASIQRVGSTVGYNDAAFFRHVFKRHIGLTPADYRNRFRSTTKLVR